MSEKLVRMMNIEDLDDIMEIEEKSFPTPWTREAFAAELTTNNLARYVVAEYEGKVVAYGGMWLIVNEGHITNVAVHPEYRGKGLGNNVVEKLIEICENVDIHDMTLEVRESNSVAISLYEKYEFENIGIRPKYYSDNNENAVIMWRRK